MKSFFVFVLSASLLVSSAGAYAADDSPLKTIVFFGDSITAGYGVRPEQTYTALLQKKIAAHKLPFKVSNAGLSGDTTSAGIDRLRWVSKQPMDMLLLALGGNDGLRGVPPETIRSNLQKMIDIAREKKPGIPIILAGMKMPPNYGAAYAKHYGAVFPAVAKKNNVHYIPFLLEGVGGIDRFNQPDRIHPTAEGQKIIAETIWKTLRPLLEK